MKIFLKPCEKCDFAEVERVSRNWWMRLVPQLRFYHCRQCQASFLASKRLVEERQWMTTTLKNFRAPSKPGALESKGP